MRGNVKTYMSAADFLDTNVLVYAYDERNRHKQDIARKLLQAAITGKSFVISSQVVAEFAATMLHKVSVPASPREVMKGLDALAAIRIIAPDNELIRRAVEAHDAYGVHFHSGMIIAAAERAGCGRILSEDFNPGQEYFGLTVTNPFA
jgi:predicted nucleic acid-binding protein